MRSFVCHVQCLSFPLTNTLCPEQFAVVRHPTLTHYESICVQRVCKQCLSHSVNCITDRLLWVLSFSRVSLSLFPSRSHSVSFAFSFPPPTYALPVSFSASLFDYIQLSLYRGPAYVTVFTYYIARSNFEYDMLTLSTGFFLYKNFMLACLYMRTVHAARSYKVSNLSR